MTLSIGSAAFREGGEIPIVYTCEGDDISPPLTFAGVPEGTRSLALIVDDPDAPDPNAPKMTWVHWVLYNLPRDCGGLGEAIVARSLPQGTRQGKNDWQRVGFRGPCPPKGRHRYFHKLFALDIRLEDLSEPTKAELERAMDGHILANATLVGTYQKKNP